MWVSSQVSAKGLQPVMQEHPTAPGEESPCGVIPYGIPSPMAAPALRHHEVSAAWCHSTS